MSEDRIDRAVQRNGGPKCIATEVHFYDQHKPSLGKWQSEPGAPINPSSTSVSESPRTNEIFWPGANSKVKSKAPPTEEAVKKVSLKDLPRRSKHIDQAVANSKRSSDQVNGVRENEKKRNLNNSPAGGGANEINWYAKSDGVVGGYPTDYFGIFNYRCNAVFDSNGNVDHYWMTRVHWEQVCLTVCISLFFFFMSRFLCFFRKKICTIGDS